MAAHGGEWNATGIDWNAGGKSGLVKFGDDNTSLVFFYNKSVEIPHKSRELGRRYCESQIYVNIQHPGETLNIIDRPMKDEDKYRYRRSWDAFLQNRSQVPEGTPIDLLFPNYPHVGENLRALGIHTIEQCSELSASAIDNIGRGGQEYVNRAKKYLESAQKGAGFVKLQAELDEERQKNRIMEREMAEIRAQLNAMQQQLVNPLAASKNPPFIKDYDPQTERINANHVTTDLVKAAKRTKKKAEPAPDPLTDPLAQALNDKEYEETLNG